MRLDSQSAYVSISSPGAKLFLPWFPRHTGRDIPPGVYIVADEPPFLVPVQQAATMESLAKKIGQPMRDTPWLAFDPELCEDGHIGLWRPYRFYTPTTSEHYLDSKDLAARTRAARAWRKHQDNGGETPLQTYLKAATAAQSANADEYYIDFRHLLLCTYCDAPVKATSAGDHLPPKSSLASEQQLGLGNLRLILPCCPRCNGLAGHWWHKDLLERWLFVKARMAERREKPERQAACAALVLITGLLEQDELVDQAFVRAVRSAVAEHKRSF